MNAPREQRDYVEDDNRPSRQLDQFKYYQQFLKDEEEDKKEKENY